MNKYIDHVYVIPEDDANRQIAVGFVDHPGVQDIRIQVMPVAGGWGNVLKTFEDEYIKKMRDNSKAHIVLLIDFDDGFTQRRELFENKIPAEIKSRVFVVGSKNTPEDLRKVLNKSFEKIGKSLADDCAAGTSEYWGHEQLNHNQPDRERLDQIVKPFLF